MQKVDSGRDLQPHSQRVTQAVFLNPAQRQRVGQGDSLFISNTELSRIPGNSGSTWKGNWLGALDNKWTGARALLSPQATNFSPYQETAGISLASTQESHDKKHQAQEAFFS